MGILSRLLLLLYVLAVITVLVVSAGVYLHLLPTQVWQNELNWLLSRNETLIVIAVMFLASLCLLSTALSSNKKTVAAPSGDVELNKDTIQAVKITIPAIQNLVERAALKVVGVRHAQAEVKNQAGDMPIKIEINVVLSQGYSAPEIGAEVRNTVNDTLRTVLQLSNVPVEIKVTEVNNAAAGREKRVV